jgi:uncharacterized protein with FMN-binding domain
VWDSQSVAQSFHVDAITGATVTSQAIKAAVFEAFKKAAGLTAR